MDYDLIIIGSGPAGMTAGLYAGRAALKAAVFEKMMGGQMANTWDIENYPGTGENVSGPELTMAMRAQCEKSGVPFVTQTVTDITLEDGWYQIETESGEAFRARTLIIATGADPRLLGVPGEKELRGMGVSYCATCDGNFFKGLRVAVVGGGNTAIEEAIYLTKFASAVTIIHRRDSFRASKALVQRAKDEPKIKFVYNSTVQEIQAGPEGAVSHVRLKNVQTGALSTLDVEGVFIFVGHIPNTGFIKGNPLFTLDDQGYIVTDASMQAGSPGLYAAGDVRQKEIRQIVTATSDGAVAALSALKYVEEFGA